MLHNFFYSTFLLSDFVLLRLFFPILERYVRSQKYASDHVLS